MTGIITSLPPLIEQPPGNNASNPAGLPGLTYTVAVLNLAQTWTALQTFPLGMITLNAADITGTLPFGVMPTPTPTTLGGIFSKTAVASQWINSIGTTGMPTSTQPAFTDISGSVAATQMPALTGDITTVAGAVATTLATVNGNVGSFGTATQVSQFTANAKGLITAAVNVTITPAIGSVTGLATNVATFLATPSSANLRAALTDETGTGLAYFQGGALGTPASGTATNLTGLPIAGITGLGTGVGTALAVNVGTAGSPVINGDVLGTPSSGTATNITGLPISTGVTGLGAGVATSLGIAAGNNNAMVTFNGNLGTPASGTATNLTGLPVATGISGLGTGVATFLATPTSANFAAAVTGETGTGAVVFATSPALVTPALGVATATSINGSTVSPGHYSGEPSTGSAAAGEIGEYVESVIVAGSAVALVTGTGKTVTSITLSAGDWDVDLSTYFNSGVGNVTSITTGMSLVTNTLDTTPGRWGQMLFSLTTPPTIHTNVPPYRFSISGSTTIFLIAQSGFTAASMAAFGIIRARRAR